MGAYSPLPWAPTNLVDEVMEHVLQPTIDEMRHRGTPFAGLLYAGLALTSHGTRVVEFNARFGDPETQVVLARLQSPLAALLMGAATGALDQLPPLRWSEDAAVTVVVASPGYPSAPVPGGVIEGIDVADDAVLHAGTAYDADGHLVSAGGRVLSIVGTGATLEDARAAAYHRLAGIHVEGGQYRTDIAELAARED
jgi:phosphoribosylamine--glycine ligase